MRAIGPLIDRLLGTILPKVGEASDRQVKAAE
jgi:hypothetical protein